MIRLSGLYQTALTVRGEIKLKKKGKDLFLIYSILSYGA